MVAYFPGLNYWVTFSRWQQHNINSCRQILKNGYFFPLPKFLRAKETAESMVTEVFKLHGLPMDVVSNQGTQYVSQF